MQHSSFIRLALFIFAIYANISYAQFLFNPLHADNILLYALALIADTLTIILLSYTWISCLFFELFKGKYYMEITYLRDKGEHLKHKSVAILIPVVNEPLQIIKKTLLAAIEMKGNKKVYLLDDGKRDELSLLAKTLGISYVKRKDRAFNKAGNLNNALSIIKEEFVAVFDADFVPKKTFLEKTLPLFVKESIALVQTPQVYYNEDNFFSKGFKNFQNLFYNYIMPSKSIQNSAICVGTNVIYRKSALDGIGGIPKIDHSEDVNTSLRLHEIKLETLYLNEELAVGLSPTNIISFFNQQFRWSKGGLMMLFRNNTLLNKNLTFDQRIQYFFSNLFYLSGIVIFIYLVTPLLAIIFNSSAINPDYFWEWVGKYSMFFVANFAFYSFIVKKNLLNSIALGLFCYIPYTRAITAAILNRNFNWKTTNTASSDLVTKLVAPFFPYLITTVAILYLFAADLIVLQSTLLLYAFWMAVNTITVIYLVINSYLSVVNKKRSVSKKWVKNVNFQTV